jgi:hypothetical protein
MSTTIDRLGAPQIQLAGLQIWIHGRQFPDDDDFWDGNWLRVTAHCGADGGEVTVSGPIIHLSEIERWRAAIEQMDEALSGRAKLCGDYEPNLTVDLTMDHLGHVAIDVRITPDQLTQSHRFKFEADQTYLRPLLLQCADVLHGFPLRGQKQAV